MGAAVYRDCPLCGYKKSLSITQSDDRLLYYCHAGCPQDSLWRAINGGHQEVALSRMAPQRTPNESQIAYLKKLWGESFSASGSLVETYLLNRGISGPIPQTIRFLPRHLHRDSEQYFPVMLAVVTNTLRQMVALHRTFLSVDGVGKADVIPPRKTLGPVGGFSCHLSKASESLAITEGIETGLSVLKETGVPTWAALSCGGIKNLILPPLPLAREVTVFADADDVGMNAARMACQRFAAEGRKAFIVCPPEGNKDFNDLLMRDVA